MERRESRNYDERRNWRLFMFNLFIDNLPEVWPWSTYSQCREEERRAEPLKFKVVLLARSADLLLIIQPRRIREQYNSKPTTAHTANDVKSRRAERLSRQTIFVPSSAIKINKLNFSSANGRRKSHAFHLTSLPRRAPSRAFLYCCHSTFKSKLFSFRRWRLTCWLREWKCVLLLLYPRTWQKMMWWDLFSQKAKRSSNGELSGPVFVRHTL